MPYSRTYCSVFCAINCLALFSRSGNRMLPRTGGCAHNSAIRVDAVFQNILLCIGGICIARHIHSLQALIFFSEITARAGGFACQLDLLPIDIDDISKALFGKVKLKAYRIGVSAAHGSLAGGRHGNRKFIGRTSDPLHILFKRSARLHFCCREAERFRVRLILPLTVSRYIVTRPFRQRIIYLRRICTRSTVIRQFPVIVGRNANIQRAILLQLCVNFQRTLILPAFHLHGGGDGDGIAIVGKVAHSGGIRRSGDVWLICQHPHVRQHPHIRRLRPIGKRISPHGKAQSQRKRKAQQFFCTMFHGVSSLCRVAVFWGGEPSPSSLRDATPPFCHLR